MMSGTSEIFISGAGLLFLSPTVNFLSRVISLLVITSAFSFLLRVSLLLVSRRHTFSFCLFLESLLLRFLLRILLPLVLRRHLVSFVRLSPLVSRSVILRFSLSSIALVP